MTDDLTLTELADLRADVHKTHELLTELKTDAANIVDRLNGEMNAITDEQRGTQLVTEYAGMLTDTRDLAALVYERIELGDAALRDEVEA